MEDLGGQKPDLKSQTPNSKSQIPRKGTQRFTEIVTERAKKSKSQIQRGGQYPNLSHFIIGMSFSIALTFRSGVRKSHDLGL